MKTARLNKAAAIRELEARLDAGRRLQERAFEAHEALAEAMVERLEWHVSVMKLLPRIPKGIQAAADFNRPARAGAPDLRPPLAEEVRRFRQALGQQLLSLERTLERVRKLGTRQLEL